MNSYSILLYVHYYLIVTFHGELTLAKVVIAKIDVDQNQIVTKVIIFK